MKNTIKDLLKSLDAYNPSVNRAMNGINKSFQTVGLLIVAILMAVEMLSWYRYLKDQNGGFSIQLFVEIAMKYVIAIFLVLNAGIFVKVFILLSGKFAELIGANDFKEIGAFAQIKKGFLPIRWTVNILAWIFGSFTMLSVKAITLLRFVELYLDKAVAPIIVAFWMADSTRVIATNFFKRAIAISFQAVIIIIILAIWKGFQIDASLKMSSDGFIGQFADGAVYITKCVIFAILLLGSQRTAKSLFQAN